MSNNNKSNSSTNYSYTLSETNGVCHFLLSNEKEYGMQSTIFRNVQTLPEQYTVHAPLLDQLFYDKEARDVVFLQVASPGKAFETYDKEKYKLPITLKAYKELLYFFSIEYPMVVSRFDGDQHIMMAGKQWLSISPTISFCGPADITYRKVLDKNVSFDLELILVRRVELNRTSVILKYTKDDMGMLYIHPPALQSLAKDRSYISSLTTYKGGSTPKRSRQS